MRVLWICNIMLPVIAKQLGLPGSNREGWLTGIFEQLTAENVMEKEKKQITLGICFPVEEQQEQTELSVKGVDCFGFRENLKKPEYYDAAMESRFREIYEKFRPDIIHIFGTEFPHALAAAKTFKRPERTLIGIQGLCYEIARVYMARLPEKVWNQVTLRDFLKRDSLKQQREKFVLRGENEKEAIRLAGHITGRTRFDREGTAQINPGALYHSMNETMRSSFYTGEWDKSRCERYRIFLGQGDYPLKGFHFLLEAMPEILKHYPQTMLYVAGNSVINHRTLKEKLKLPAYGKYLLSLIRKNHLEDKVVILGRLTEEEMKEQFLKSGVFVCPSILENSPNTMAEAMLLGVPVAAARTGGIPDMLLDGREGILFAPGNPAELAKAVEAVFDDTVDEQGLTMAEHISVAGRRRAQMAHDGATNFCRLLEIYEDIGAKT